MKKTKQHLICTVPILLLKEDFERYPSKYYSVICTDLISKKVKCLGKYYWYFNLLQIVKSLEEVDDFLMRCFVVFIEYKIFITYYVYVYISLIDNKKIILIVL